ncbi:MAG: hypothetical protein E6Q36_05610 [Chryseobacterium sp.]|nr:MAG: hypothetical protein E6Q36_05610 [Chryseobacterium sp.]
MSKKGDLIYLGKKCPYCQESTEFVDSSSVYSQSYGMIYICRPCKAWVGVHKDTNVALGRLAKIDLRKKKKEAHHYFDKLWNKKIEKGFKKGKARGIAYKWLSVQLGIPKEETHIGWFDIDMCQRVIDICKPIVEKLNL